MVLSACGGSGSVSNGSPAGAFASAFMGVPTGAAAAAPPEAQVDLRAFRSLVEDFPLSANIRYAPGTAAIGRPRSVDFNGSSLLVLEEGGRAGAIDVANDLLYAQQERNFLPDVLDVDEQAELQWFVVGDGKLHQRDKRTGVLRSFTLGENIELSELAVADGVVWLYERRQHRIHRFDIQAGNAKPLQLKGALSRVVGLSVRGDSLWLLGEAQPAQMVVSLKVEGPQRLVQSGAWRIDGFKHLDFNDLTRTADDRWVVSRADAKDSLYLLNDKDRFKGEGPIAGAARMSPVAKMPLPAGIAQPSGLFQRKDGTWLLVTDQAELKRLTPDFGAVLSSTPIRFDNTPCTQGCTEAVISPTDDEVLVVSDSGWVAHYRGGNSGNFVKASEFRLPLPEGIAVAGIAHDPVANLYFVVNDSDAANQQDSLFVLDGNFALLQSHPLRYDGAVDGSINTYRANGLAYREGALFLVSSTYTKLLKLSVTGQIVGVYEFDEVSEPTDVAYSDGHWWITGDHEDGEAVPPVIGYKVPG
jgi:sugar lactone lactonase YvrE